MIVVEVVRFLGKAFRGYARKDFEVANKMRLIGEVESARYVCQSCKLSGFDQSYRFIKASHPNIHLRSEANRLNESSFKLPLRNMQGCKQIFDMHSTAVMVNQAQAFFH